MTLGKGRFRPIETELYNLLKMVTFIKASLALLGLEPKSFKVTPKGASKGLAAISQLVWPYYAFIGCATGQYGHWRLAYRWSIWRH